MKYELDVIVCVNEGLEQRFLTLVLGDGQSVSEVTEVTEVTDPNPSIYRSACDAEN